MTIFRRVSPLLCISPQKRYLFTKSRAAMVAVGVFLCSLSLSSGYLSTSHISQEDQCSIRHTSYNLVVSYLCIITPACLTSLLTALLALTLRNNQRKRLHTFVVNQMAGTTLGIGVGSDLIRQRLHAQAHTENALTTMLLFAVLVFLVFSFPLFLLITELVPEISDHYSTLQDMTNYMLFRAVAKQLEVFSHSLNFIIYFLSARKFRTALAKLCRCSDNKAR